MPRSLRIKRADFATASRQAKRLVGIYFSLSVSRSATGFKCACVVSKKVSKSAVVRNRVKRLCREIVRTTVSHDEKAVSLIFYAKKEAATADFPAIKADIESLLKSI